MKSLFFAALLASGSAAACDAPPPAAIDIIANSYYTDSHHSVIDPARRASNIAHTKPIEDFLGQVAQDANGGDAACGLAWLASWAGQKALLGKASSEQAYYVRKWTLGGLALNYARIQAQATPAQRQAIEAWLRALADEVVAHADAHKGGRNNHYYWEGLAVTAVGAGTGDRRYQDWGRAVFAYAMGQMAPDGALPAEMERAAKALHYQVYAATPLVMMASILDLHDPRLDRLVAFTVAASADPSGIARRTGFAQEPVGSAEVSVIYDRHAGRPQAAAARRLWQPRLGGDLQTPNPLEHPGAAQPQ